MASLSSEEGLSCLKMEPYTDQCTESDETIGFVIVVVGLTIIARHGVEFGTNAEVAGELVFDASGEIGAQAVVAGSLIVVVSQTEAGRGFHPPMVAQIVGKDKLRGYVQLGDLCCGILGPVERTDEPEAQTLGKHAGVLGLQLLSPHASGSFCTPDNRRLWRRSMKDRS